MTGHFPLGLRPARPEDATAVASLLHQLGYATSIEAARTRIESLARRSDVALHLAEVDGRVVALIEVDVMEAIQHDPRAEIRALVVDEAHRGQGIGERLVRWAESWARERALPAIRVRSNVQRERTRLFYERLGYRVSKTSAIFDKPL